MNDQDIIKQAYADSLKKIYGVFFESYLAAQTDIDRDQAKQRFKSGVDLARKTRDVAIASV